MVTLQVWRTVEQFQMIVPGERVLAAVSGGKDSMCLLHLLWRAQDSHDFILEAAVFDHQIRPEAAGEAAFVQRWCQERDIPCHLGRDDVPRLARERGKGLEETARDVRYAFLERIASEVGASKIATAHNADDNAETLLLHLLRGSGLRGLGGIPPVRGKLIRPLLTVSRADIERYLLQWDVPSVEDASNADCSFRRNAIRHEVLPLLKTYNPRLLEGLTRSIQGFRADNAFLEAQADRAAAAMRHDGDVVRFPVGELLRLPEALSHRVLQRLACASDAALVLTAAQREALLALCRSDAPSARLSLPNGRCARREYGMLILAPEPSAQIPAPVTLQPGKCVRFGARMFSCALETCPKGKFNQPDSFYLRPSAQPLLLRPRRTGDSIALPARSRKTVKKLLIDCKIPRLQRDQIAVFEAEGQLAALDRFGADQHFLPQPEALCWHITCHDLPDH